MFDKTINFLLDHESQSLALIFIFLIICGCGVPIPEDILLVAGGVLVSDGSTTFLRALVTCMAGVLIGDSTIYWMGRLIGNQLLSHKYIAMIIKPSLIDLVSKYFHSDGNKIVLAARFLPGLRAPTFFFFGSRKKSYLSFILTDGFAALISVPIWIYVGKLFGENLDYLEDLVKRMKYGTVILIIFLIFIFIAGVYLKKLVIRVLVKKDTNNRNHSGG